MIREKGEEFRITQEMVNKIKKIKQDKLLIEDIQFASPPFGTNEKALRKIASKLVGSKNVGTVKKTSNLFRGKLTNFIKFETKEGKTGSLIRDTDIIQLINGLLISVGKQTPRSQRIDLEFNPDLKQDIIIPKVEIFELRDRPGNPGNKNMIREKGEEFTITQEMVNKIKKIKQDKLLIEDIEFGSPPFGTNEKALRKIASKLVGSKNVGTVKKTSNLFRGKLTNFIKFETKEGKTGSLIRDTDIIKITNGLLISVGKQTPRDERIDLEFNPDLKQDIIIPKVETFELRDRPGNKNEVKTNLIFANPTFNKSTAERTARLLGFPVGRIRQLPNAIDIETSERFNPINFKFKKERKINRKIIERILTNIR